MKLFTMISVLSAFLALFTLNYSEELHTHAKEEGISIEGPISSAILKTANGCGVGNFLIPLLGDTSQAILPMLTALSYEDPKGYKIVDTIPGNAIKGLAFKRDEWQENSSLISNDPQYPYVVISDIGMVSYFIPDDFSPQDSEITKIEEIAIPGIRRVAHQITAEVSNPIVLLIDQAPNDYQITSYAYPALEEQFNFDFHFEPEVFEVVEEDLFISGTDTNGIYSLYHFSALQDTLYAKHELNELAANAQELLVIGDAVYLLSSPGDSLTMLSTISTQSGSLSQSIVYSESGARATHNEFKDHKYFTFQPLVDSSNGFLEENILILDPLNNQLDTFLVNLELDYFKNAGEVSQSFGFYTLSWVGAKWETNSPDTFYMNESGFDNIKLASESPADFINATYGCWVSVIEKEKEKIKFEYFPNPASSEVTINLSGLTKGRAYKLDVLDEAGKIHHSCLLEAYQKLELPLEKLPKGIYFLNLDTGKNLITKKLILQ